MHSRTREAAETAVLDHLRHIVRALRLSSHSSERELGISGAQLFVLRELAAEPGASLRLLAERTLTDPSSVSVVAARLVERGLVNRGRDPSDARRVALTLTRRGHALLARAPEPIQVQLISALQKMEKKRLLQLEVTLEELVIAIGADSGPAPMFFDDEPSRSKRHGA
jgi:DNA-binding MarR family transcriptional regulator